MKLEAGSRYWFWNVKEERACRITVTECTPSDFAFTFGGKKGRSTYEAVEGCLFENKYDMPQYRHKSNTDIDADDEEELGFDNLVGFEHSDTSGNGYGYYPSIYYYQGSDDRLTYGSVYSPSAQC